MNGFERLRHCEKKYLISKKRQYLAAVNEQETTPKADDDDSEEEDLSMPSQGVVTYFCRL